MKVWRETEHSLHLYYDDGDGKIVGSVHKLGHHSIIFIAKILNDNVEHILGQYISSDFAKKAIERFWLIQEKTLLE